jgi:hypothetical protein
MKRILTRSQWSKLERQTLLGKDLRERDQPEPAQPRMQTPVHLVAVDAQGTRLVRPINPR